MTPPWMKQLIALTELMTGLLAFAIGLLIVTIIFHLDLRCNLESSAVIASIAECICWVILSAILMSFVEHQIHRKLVHRRNCLIRLNVRKAPIKALPIAAPIALISLQGAVIFLAVVTFHHWIWNNIHLEMHKPTRSFFSTWPAYKFLARHHYLHHRYQDKNFNVVFPFADYVLRTNAHASKTDLDEMNVLGLL
jgi:hypothetical protein